MTTLREATNAAAVKLNVRRLECLRVVQAGGHFVEPRLHGHQVPGGCPLGRPARDVWLDQVAHFDQRTDQRRIGAFFQHPVQHVGIEVIPTAHEALQTALGGIARRSGVFRQNANGFADDVARGFELFAELRLGGGQYSAHNALGQFLFPKCGSVAASW